MPKSIPPTTAWRTTSSRKGHLRRLPAAGGVVAAVDQGADPRRTGVEQAAPPQGRAAGQRRRRRGQGGHRQADRRQGQGRISRRRNLPVGDARDPEPGDRRRRPHRRSGPRRRVLRRLCAPVLRGIVGRRRRRSRLGPRRAAERRRRTGRYQADAGRSDEAVSDPIPRRRRRRDHGAGRKAPGARRQPRRRDPQPQADVAAAQARHHPGRRRGDRRQVPRRDAGHGRLRARRSWSPRRSGPKSPTTTPSRSRTCRRRCRT